MRLIANGVNNEHLTKVLEQVDRKQLEAIDAAVAYATNIDELARLAQQTNVPFSLYTVLNEDFPNPGVMQKFLGAAVHWQLFVTRDYFHAKVLWLRGVGAYIGSANLTDKAWWQNIECGLWLDEEELEQQGLYDQLQHFFSHLGASGRFAAATTEHLESVRQLARGSGKVSAATKELQALADKLLLGVPGSEPPLRTPQSGDEAAMRNFIKEWEDTLTILRKMSKRAETAQWPAWVDKSMPPSIVQDQATEYWWNSHVRRLHDVPSETSMARFHELHRKAPDAVVEQVFAEWSHAEASPDWVHFVNQGPKIAQALLAKEAIATLDEEKLTRLILNTHAARDHARQARKSDLGDLGAKSSLEERCRLLAAFWSKQKPAPNRGVREVLHYVIWGDAIEPNIAARLWRATHDHEWKISRLGLSILGELIGYARPSQYPPRNSRVSRTLKALGFAGIKV